MIHFNLPGGGKTPPGISQFLGVSDHLTSAVSQCLFAFLAGLDFPISRDVGDDARSRR
jgi:hypothetical protein